MSIAKHHNRTGVKPRGYASADLIERILKNTTVTTQRVAHNNIIEIGDKLLSYKTEDVKDDRDKEIQKAVEDIEARGTRELKAAVERIKEEQNVLRENSLESQKQYYERYVKRVFNERDKLEEENAKTFCKKLHNEKNDALISQRRSFDEELARAIQQTTAQERQRVLEEINEEITREKENALIHAMKVAKEEAAIEIANIKKQYKRQKKDITDTLNTKHRKELECLNNQVAKIKDLFQNEQTARRQVETEYELLQQEYMRFLDFTDGMFHSDYLIKVKNYGRGVTFPNLL